MIKIYPRINSVIGATLDRIDVRKYSSKEHLDEINDKFLKSIVNESGPLSNNPITMCKHWAKAYHANLKKQMMIDNIRTLVKLK